MRSRTGLSAAAMAGNLPDVDIPLGWLLHNDAWKMHRTWTHTAAFALTLGALAGLAGVVRAESVEGERDLIADTLTGVAVVGSHLVLTRSLPSEVPVGPSVAGRASSTGRSTRSSGVRSRGSSGRRSSASRRASRWTGYPQRATTWLAEGTKRGSAAMRRLPVCGVFIRHIRMSVYVVVGNNGNFTT